MSKSIHPVAKRGVGLGALLAFVATGLAASLPALAQDDDEMIFEEIVVLATKRATNIMEVPVAVSIMTGAQIEEAGIKDLIDLQQNVPGLIVGQSQTATTTNFNIRAVGSTSNNFGVESSVGLYVDGVYRSRQSSMINDLVDVEAVEVLRGPQGTLFGKNTAAGAILIRSVRPSQDRDAFVDVTVGDLGLIKVGAATNIPINDDWAFRGTLFSAQRDGYVDDLNFGKDAHNDKDRLGMRLQLAKNQPGDDFAARIILDYSEIDETCCVAVNRIDSLFYPFTLALGPGAANGSDAAAVALGGTVFDNFGYPQPFIDGFAGFPGTIVQNASFEDYVTATNFLPISENEDSGLSVELEWALDNGMTFKSITAYRSFETFDFIDGDFSDVDIFTRTQNAEQESFSQEFQLIGEFGNGSNFVTGLYYFGQTIESDSDITGGALFGTFIGLLNPGLQQIVDGVNGISAATMGAIPPATEPFPLGTTAFDIAKQDHAGWAAFGEVNFSISDEFTLTLGARYTDEDKDIDTVFTQTANGPPPDLNAIGLNLFLASQGMAFDPTSFFAVAEPNLAWGSYQFDPLAPRPNINESISDDQSTGNIKLTYFPSDSTMLYASFSTGFKSGGTNTDRINAVFNPVFGAETSESMELGFKGTIGPVQMAVTLYDTEFDDFQANSFFGSGFNLQNAGTLTIEGYELEFDWRPTDSTKVQGFWAHNEGEYKTFVDGTAWDSYVFQTGEFDPGCAPPASGLITDRPQGCDHSGYPLAYNPEDRGFVAITQDIELSGSTSMFIRGEYTYIDEQFTDGDSDPFTLQDDISLVNLRIGFYFDNIGSTLTFWGRNITDERYYHGSFDVPVTEDKQFSYPSEPATYGVTFNKTFE